ncbi:MAG: serine hydrolase domain-containing protein [Kibdelosporangium sp.]
MFSKARLGRMHDVLAGHVTAGLIPGLVTLVSRRGETHVSAIGTMSVGGGEMQQDTIFRIASMTKPVIAVATLILVEECVLRLDDPVDKFLPELADRQVLTSIDAALDSTVPADRPITARDLLTFRLGFGMVFEDLPISRAANERSVGTGRPRRLQLTPDEWLRNLGELPLMHQPGEKWLYNTGSDVLGVLIERACGQSLDMFLRERIFEPLGMADTGFFVPPEKLSRFATSYVPDPETDELSVYDEPNGMWSSLPLFLSGAGGLVSTATDFDVFGQMMLNNGKYGSERILSRAAVELMTTDQLTPAQKAVSGFVPGYFDNRGWGFGVGVDTGRVDLNSVGRFGWDGGLGTSWWADPAEDLSAILLTQRMAFPLSSPVYLDFWTSVYQAVD